MQAASPPRLAGLQHKTWPWFSTMTNGLVLHIVPIKVHTLFIPSHYITSATSPSPSNWVCLINFHCSFWIYPPQQLLDLPQPPLLFRPDSLSIACSRVRGGEVEDIGSGPNHCEATSPADAVVRAAVMALLSAIRHGIVWVRKCMDCVSSPTFK